MVMNMSLIEELEKGFYSTLSWKDKDRMLNLNKRNGYGISASQLRRLCTEHQKARQSGDSHTMQMIEYRLTDINFHHECSMLYNGKYDELRDELRKKWN